MLYRKHTFFSCWGLLGFFCSTWCLCDIWTKKCEKTHQKNHQTPAEHQCGNSTFTISFTELFMCFEKQYYCFDLPKPFSCDKQLIAYDC